MLGMDGALIIDKPAGLTSHDVVARVRRALGLRRVGHTGTLDPFATGVLVVLVGRATRLAQFLSGAEKEYEGVIRFGYATETGDLTGGRLDDDETELTRRTGTKGIRSEAIEAALASLRGEIEQTPPMYSAKKVQGRKLYELARRGEEIERAPVRVNISKFEALAQSGELLRHNEDGTCDLCVQVVCSAGTYVRTLAESVGQLLGVGAHLSALRRTRAGQFRIERALSLGALELTSPQDIANQILISPNEALAQLPFVRLNATDAGRVRNGAGVPVTSGMENEWGNEQPVRMRDEKGDLLAVGFYDEVKHLLLPAVVIAPPVAGNEIKD